MKKQATTQQKKLIWLLMDVTKSTPEQIARETRTPVKSLNSMKNMTAGSAGRVIDHLVKLAKKQGVPEYRYRPFPVKVIKGDRDS